MMKVEGFINNHFADIRGVCHWRLRISNIKPAINVDNGYHFCNAVISAVLTIYQILGASQDNRDNIKLYQAFHYNFQSIATILSSMPGNDISQIDYFTVPISFIQLV